MKPLLALVFVLVSAMASCHGSRFNLVVGSGTLSPGSGDCNAWIVRSDDGRAYELTSLAPAFQRNGLRVRFTLRMRDDRMSACMVGRIADVVEMRPGSSD